MKTTDQRWWVVTDLDGTLMDHHYDWSAAESTIRWLQSCDIPVIPCTSKTAEEVRGFRQAIGLHDPFIVENGGSIHGQAANGEEWEVKLGPDWQALRPKLELLAQALGEPLRRLDELSDVEGDQLLGLTGEPLRMAQRRRCSIPFVAPSPASRSRLMALAREHRLTVVQGNRMAHLLGGGISKGRALQALKQRQNAMNVKVLALGDSPNDQPLLDVADLAVVVPSSQGPHADLRPGLSAGRYLLAGAPHAAGWAEAVRRLIGSRMPVT